MNLARVIEALLFSAQKPLAAKEIVDVLRRAGAEDDFAPNEFAKVREAEVAAALRDSSRGRRPNDGEGWHKRRPNSWRL